MRELTFEEMEMVSGGAWSVGDILAAATAIGGGIGLGSAQAAGATGTAAVGMTALGAAGLAAVVASGMVGYAIGTAIYNAATSDGDE